MAYTQRDRKLPPKYSCFVKEMTNIITDMGLSKSNAHQISTELLIQMCKKEQHRLQIKMFRNKYRNKIIKTSINTIHYDFRPYGTDWALDFLWNKLNKKQQLSSISYINNKDHILSDIDDLTEIITHFSSFVSTPK
tara:strand:- start:1298 stop:1705 length:408 start_codon:yes stop_codon:yes gene_type:complete